MVGPNYKQEIYNKFGSTVFGYRIVERKNDGVRLKFDDDFTYEFRVQ